MRKIPIATCLSIALLGGCSDPHTPLDVNSSRFAYVATDDPLGESVTKVVYLGQNWSPEESLRFYTTPQGSQLVPYAWFLALEQADSTTPFRDNRNILRYRYLPQETSETNPDGLPVGFVASEGVERRWLGFTCAACHTNEIRYKDVGYRIDGAPTQADVQAFLSDLTGALRTTRDDSEKFARFASKVLEKDSPKGRSDLKADLALMIQIRDGYNLRNFPGYDPKTPGPQPPTRYGRLDAVDAIVNEAFWRTVKAPSLDHPLVAARPCDAPVSYPFLWDTPQHVFVEWLGFANNGDEGSSLEGLRGDFSGLPRNAGEVLGVFGDFTIPDGEIARKLGYSSSVKFRDLIALNRQLMTLWSPEWPDAFPEIDKARAALGAELYRTPSTPGKQDSCIDCHAVIDRMHLDRTKISIDAKKWATGTDPRASDNFFGSTRPSGKLEGFRFFSQPEIKSPSEADPVVTNVVTGVLLGFYKEAPPDPLKTLDFSGRRGALLESAQGAAYKGRPLDGIWATAPYLHNGSVPTLDDLLKPVAERPKSFSVGTRTFDPIKVGYQDDVPGFPKFHVENPDGTPITGNSNAGHTFGSQWNDEQRAQVVEYLKTL